jgi:large subunit ribosomal protein L31
MKHGIHPNYREVCFIDLSNGFKFVTRSCANTKETMKMDDGRELPLYKLGHFQRIAPFLHRNTKVGRYHGWTR